MNGSNVLITGSSGFIGKKLVKKLLETGEINIAVTTRDTLGTQKLFGDKVRHILINDKKFKQDILDFSPEVVIHLASFSTSSDDIKSITNLIDSNLLFLTLLLDALKEVEIKLFINTGSFSEYIDNDAILSPAYLYSATKTASRSILKYYKKLSNFKLFTVTPYSVYGGISKSKKVIEIIFDSLDSKTPVMMTDGNQISDFIHVDDVVSFYSYILNNNGMIKDNGEYFLGTGRGVSIKNVAKIVENISGKKANILWGALRYRENDIMLATAPKVELEKELNWKHSLSLEDGILKMFNGGIND
jgi:nucleoside-diphosphate-sugar epimerase